MSTFQCNLCQNHTRTAGTSKATLTVKIHFITPRNWIQFLQPEESMRNGNGIWGKGKKKRKQFNLLTFLAFYIRIFLFVLYVFKKHCAAAERWSRNEEIFSLVQIGVTCINRPKSRWDKSDRGFKQFAALILCLLLGGRGFIANERRAGFFSSSFVQSLRSPNREKMATLAPSVRIQ